MLDAVNLGWKLAADLGGWAPADLLDSYHRERHFAGARSMLQTQAQVALRRGQDPAAEALRELFQDLLTGEPLRRLGAMIAGTDVRYPGAAGQHELTGTFAPDLTLRTGQETVSVADLMHSGRPLLLAPPTGRSCARPAGTGSTASIFTPRRPVTGPPTPC
jgi:hypothetical protein